LEGLVDAIMATGWKV